MGAARRRTASLQARSGIAARGRAPLAAAAGGFLSVTLVAGASGGYYPDAWGWLVLAFGWVAALALLLRKRISLGRMDIAAGGALALFTAWIGLSIGWSDDVPQSVLELQRALVYLVGLVAALAVLSRRSLPFFLGGLLAGVTTACAAGLLTRLFPPRGAGEDLILLNRLADPIGYWNALGIFAAMGVLLALGFAAHGQRLASRVAAAGAVPILVTTLYFTYSRGAWIALAIGALAAIAVDPRRVRLVTVALLLAPAPAAAVWVSSRSSALTRLEAPHELIVQDGRRVALLLLALVGLAALASLAASLGAARLRPTARVQRGWGLILGCAAAAGIALALVRLDGPVAMAQDAYGSFKDEDPAPASESARNDLNRRLFTLSNNGRIDYWEASWSQSRGSPMLGAGAGAFEQLWLRVRSYPSHVRDAHGLYAEVLGELGWTGVALLVATLAAPLIAGVRARRDPLVSAAFGGLAAFAVHAGVDWDWEIPAVTLVALACAAALLVCDRARTERPVTFPFAGRVAVVVALVACAGFSAIGLVGNRALERAEVAAESARWREVERDALQATRFAPWAAAGWQHLGNAQLGLGRTRQARATLLEAVRKDPSDWRIWFDLGTARSGRARLQAYRRAARLNPFADDVQVLRQRGYRIPKAPEPIR